MAIDKTNDIKVGGTLHSIATGNIIAHADEIMDETWGSNLAEINQKLKSDINNVLSANDAMVFKGTIGTGGTVTALPNTHEVGWTYKVILTGVYAGNVCEVGDMLVCITDGTAANDAHWTVIQSNLDGAVTGPTSAVANRVATFNGNTGKVIKDSGYTIASSVPANAKFTDTTYELATETSDGLMSSADKVFTSTIYEQMAAGNTYYLIMGHERSITATPYAGTNYAGCLLSLSGLRYHDSNRNFSFSEDLVEVGMDIPMATTTAAGAISAADKLKLDNLDNSYVLKIGDTMTGNYFIDEGKLTVFNGSVTNRTELDKNGITVYYGNSGTLYHSHYIQMDGTSNRKRFYIGLDPEDPYSGLFEFNGDTDNYFSVLYDDFKADLHSHYLEFYSGIKNKLEGIITGADIDLGRDMNPTDPDYVVSDYFIGFHNRAAGLGPEGVKTLDADETKLLHSNGGTTSVKTINGTSLLGEGNISTALTWIEIE